MEQSHQQWRGSIVKSMTIYIWHSRSDKHSHVIMQLYLKLCEREKNTTGMSGEQINETLVVMNNYGLL